MQVNAVYIPKVEEIICDCIDNLDSQFEVEEVKEDLKQIIKRREIQLFWMKKIYKMLEEEENN